MASQAVTNFTEISEQENNRRKFLEANLGTGNLHMLVI